MTSEDKTLIVRFVIAFVIGTFLCYLFFDPMTRDHMSPPASFHYYMDEKYKKAVFKGFIFAIIVVLFKGRKGSPPSE